MSLKIIREIGDNEDVDNALEEDENFIIVLFLKKDEQYEFSNYKNDTGNNWLYSHIMSGYGILSGIDFTSHDEVKIGDVWMPLSMFHKILVKGNCMDIYCIDDLNTYVNDYTVANYKHSEILKWYIKEFGTFSSFIGKADNIELEEKITNQKEIRMNNKIGMTYSGEMAVARGDDYLIYTADGKLNNVKNAVIEMRTAILEVTKTCLKRGDIILHNNEYVFIDTIENNITLVSVNGKKFDLIEEMSAGMPSPIYKKVVNPLDSSQIGNPMVAMSMMTNGTSMDPVSQMALMNILNGKKEDSRVGKMEESIASMAESIKMLADVVAIAVNKE